jgi:hypothetical protein
MKISLKNLIKKILSFNHFIQSFGERITIDYFLFRSIPSSFKIIQLSFKSSKEKEFRNFLKLGSTFSSIKG